MQLQSSQIPEVTADPELSAAFVTYPQAANQFLAMNLTQEPFKDKKVREAFAYAIDRETLCAEIRSGDCLPTLSCIPEGLPGAIETDQYAFDPEAARQALAESSYGGPDNLPEIKLYFNSDYRGARPAVGVDRRTDPRHSGRRAHHRTDGRRRAHRPAQGSDDAPAAGLLRQLVSGLPRPAELAQRLLDVRLQPQHRRLLQ